MPYLHNHQVFSSKDLHEMQDLLTSLTNTDKVDVVGKGNDVDASLCLASFSGMNLFHVTYGDVQTRIHTYARDEDTLLLFAMTGGMATVNHGGKEFEITPEVGMMRNIREPLTALQNGFESFAVPLPVELLKRHARTLLGDDAPLGGGRIRRSVRYDHFGRAASTQYDPLHCRSAEQPVAWHGELCRYRRFAGLAAVDRPDVATQRLHGSVAVRFQGRLCHSLLRQAGPRLHARACGQRYFVGATGTPRRMWLPNPADRIQ